MRGNTNEGSVVIFERAAIMLAEADTIQKAKELKSLALTAADWAKRKGMGEDAVMHARSYALEAERKMGEMLKDSERAKGNQHRKSAECLAGTEQNQTLSDLGISKKESSNAQKLATLDDDVFQSVKTGETTRKEATKNGPHVSQNSGDNEWYTPKEYIDAARSVMGGIDLDPASHEAANKVVKATRFYTEDNDGLGQEWAGRVWMNPPYAGDRICKFTSKLSEAVSGGSVTTAVVLVNNATETRWFRSIADISSALCFPTGRVKFWHPRKIAVPLQGQCIAYVGGNHRQFCKTFMQFGFVVTVVR